jgi:hypothetical protein
LALPSVAEGGTFHDGGLIGASFSQANVRIVGFGNSMMAKTIKLTLAGNGN